MQFIRGILKLPIIWQIWVILLMAINGVWSVFFIDRPIAFAMFVSLLTGGIVGMILAQVHGFTKLLGLMHAPWVPVFALQIVALYREAPSGNYAAWFYTSLTVTGISLIIDIYDVWLYVRGNRNNLLKV